MKTNNKILILSIFVIIGMGVMFYALSPHAPTKDLSSFATCLKDKGATFYGAFWCSHCENQKKVFGDAAKLLPYVECSTPDGNAQLPVCTEKNIDGYPTWEFADGSRLSGEVQLSKLAEKTGCTLP